ncbi:MAG: DUF6884 domain-containing protein [Fimbriimonadaceae bacterium]
MTQADVIRQFALQHIVASARATKRIEFTIRAGDLHKSMGLTSAMPAVCSAIGGNKFEQLAQVTRIGRTGPANGSNVYFSFRIGPRSTSASASAPPVERVLGPRSGSVESVSNLDLRNALVLVSCVKSKRPHAAPARDLYTSAWFTKARDLVEKSEARWFVLSSRYGLVSPEAMIEPYDYTLNTLGVQERKAWAKKVLEQLEPQLKGTRRVVMLAGQRYREFLMQPLEKLGIAVEVPMQHKTRGQQLAWLTDFQ